MSDNDTITPISGTDVKFQSVTSLKQAAWLSLASLGNVALDWTTRSWSAHRSDSRMLSNVRNAGGQEVREGTGLDYQTLVLDGSTHVLENRKARAEHTSDSLSFAGRALELLVAKFKGRE